MALMGGHRFAVEFGEVFPAGVFALLVDQAQDFDEKSGRRSPAKDKVSGQLVWTVTCIARDPEARRKEVKVKVSAPVQPVFPRTEVAEGSGLYAVEFDGLTVTPYVDSGSKRLAFSFRASALRAAQSGGQSGGRSSSASSSASAPARGAVKDAA